MPQAVERAQRDVEPGMLGQPATHLRGLMPAVVVENEMNVEARRNRRVNGLEELEKPCAPMPSMTLANHRAGGHIDRGEERRGPMPPIIVRDTLLGILRLSSLSRS